jgi:hypothetical protein
LRVPPPLFGGGEAECVAHVGCAGDGAAEQVDGFVGGGRVVPGGEVPEEGADWMMGIGSS